MPGHPDQIVVQIVHAGPQGAILKSLLLEQGARIEDALKEAATHASFEGVDLLNSPVGIFGKLARKEQILKDGDRIEIYRPLLQEPKLARRKRARGLKGA